MRFSFLLILVRISLKEDKDQAEEEGSGSSRLKKRFALATQRLFQLLRAIAITAGASRGPIFVAAGAGRVRSVHAQKLEVLFPVSPVSPRRRIAKASFHPGRHNLALHSSFAHHDDGNPQSFRGRNLIFGIHANVLRN